MRALKFGDIVESLIDDTFTHNGTTYKTLIKGHRYKVVGFDISIHPDPYPIELQPIGEPDTSVYAKASELKLVSEGVAA
ncbi:hypothetical protein [Acinetobacter sp. YH12140]|uniref:hypothetical protein n=1 Tax=Acinetobacter sp. YH12140 TaxID=2601124 RepID=UPI0015D1E537|nr:hypothetical protein [Acinetobacter sp. YH12140]